MKPKYFLLYKLNELTTKIKKIIILLNSISLIKYEVSFFPLFYLLIIYVMGLADWITWNEESIYILWAGQEKLSEYFQFMFYLSASIIAAINVLKNKYKLFSLQNYCWIIFLIFTTFICIEEISFLNSTDGGIFQVIREYNTQGEINFHNNKLIQPFLQLAFILFNLFLGWIGWRYFPKIEAVPKKIYSLYFLSTSIAYSLMEFPRFIRYFFPKVPYIFIHQEIFEFLMAMGLFLHAFKMLKYYSRN